jgi:hypothetical protein
MKFKWLAVAVVLCLVSAVYAEYVPFKVSLNLFERLTVMSLLPKESNFTTLKIINDLNMELAPTEEEINLSELKVNNDGTVSAIWGKVPEKEFTLGEIAKKVIVDALKKLNKEDKLQMQYYTIYEKFVGGE